MGKYIHDSKLINESFDCHYINLTTAKNLEDIGHFRLGKIVEFVKLLHRIRKTIKQLKPDLVYVTPNAKGGAFYKDFIVVEMIKSMGCKVIVHYHNKGVATRQDRWLDDKLYRKFFHGIKVILLAEALYPDVQKYVRRKDVYICPNGIPEQELILKKKHSGFNILFISNMMKEKGVFVLLDACQILKDRNFNFHCHFVGKWSDISEKGFNRYVDEHQLQENVTAYGAKYGDEKTKFFALADLLVFPTYYHNECFPLVLLEAMQQKITCIASDEGGIPDIVDDGNTGYIVPKKDANVIADKIEYLYNYPEVNKQMGENGYRKYNEMFTLNIFERRFTDVLIEVVNNNKDN